jgi:hypothetical protein
LKIPEKSRGASEWNNLGVQFNSCDLPYKSISAYRKAEELKETLAMSNLANLFIKSGFLNEADELCKRAVTYDDCHKNIYETISRIKNIPDQEAEKEKPILNNIKPLSEFYRGYGYASLQPNPGDIDGQWQGPRCVLKLSIKNNRLFASGKYEISLGLGNLLASPFTTTQLNERHFNIEYEGQVSGRAIKGFVSESSTDKSTTAYTGHTLLTSFGVGGVGAENRPIFLMILSESLNEISVYEKSSGKELNLYSLKRID